MREQLIKVANEVIDDIQFEIDNHPKEVTPNKMKEYFEAKGFLSKMPYAWKAEQSPKTDRSGTGLEYVPSINIFDERNKFICSIGYSHHAYVRGATEERNPSKDKAVEQAAEIVTAMNQMKGFKS